MSNLIKVGVVVISFLLGTIAWSANSVTVQTLTVDPGASSVTVGVFIENDVELAGIQIPLEFREVNAGSYITNSLTHTVQGRVAASGLMELVVEYDYPDPDAGNPCSGPVSQSYSAEGAVDYISPDAHLWIGVKMIGPCLPAGSDGNTPSFVFTFDVTNTMGAFEIDTCCVEGSAHLLFAECETGQQISPSFTKGVVTIAPAFDHKMHFPQLPDPNGWDVNATELITLADDWQCSETGWVKDLHFWGSWKGDIEGSVIGFIVSIHDNIPSGPNGYSIPGDPLWGPFMIEDYSVIPLDLPSSQGWYDPATGEVIPNDHQNYFQYDILLPDAMWFMQGIDQIYWLRISAVVADPAQTQWGWKNSQDHFMDDAVWAPDPYDPLPPWIELYEPDGGGGNPISNQWGIVFDEFGEPLDAYGENAFPGGFAGWWLYPSGWWNVWFFDHPFDTERYKEITIDAWYIFKINPDLPSYIELAVNWSTDQWTEEGEPPLPGVDEEIYIGRATLLEGPDIEGEGWVFEYTIPDYNPVWVSIDVRGENFIIEGVITHECLPQPQSLDLSFVITGEPEDPVYDLWETPENHNTYVDFGCPTIYPISADFFGPGSDPFEGIIALQGEPLTTTGDLGPTDTIVKRYRAADLPECPSQDQIEIEIVALNLVSTAPITVTYDGGQDPEDWDVKVCLSESVPQPSGTTTFNRVCQEGGTFTAYIPVIPMLVFTRISDGLEVHYDFSGEGQTIEYEVADGHWLFSDPGFDIYTANGTEQVSNCDDIPDIPIGRSAVDLIPGLQAIPCENCSEPPFDYDIPITALTEPGNCAQHEVWPPHDVTEDIPTLSEWGMIILALLLLAVGTIAIVRKKKAVLSKSF